MKLKPKMHATQMETHVSKENAFPSVKTIIGANVLMDTKVKKFANTFVETRPHAALAQNPEFVLRQKIHIYVYVILKVFSFSVIFFSQKF